MAEPLFREYEAIVLEYLLEPILPDEVVDDIIENSTFVSLEVTGAGYFLTVRHPWIGSRRVLGLQTGSGVMPNGISMVLSVSSICWQHAVRRKKVFS